MEVNIQNNFFFIILGGDQEDPNVELKGTKFMGMDEITEQTYINNKEFENFTFYPATDCNLSIQSIHVMQPQRFCYPLTPSFNPNSFP